MLAALEKYISRFVALSPREFAALAQIVEKRVCDRKVRITDQGEQEHYLHFVQKGLVRKFFRNGREEVITHIAREGELISSSVAFFSGKPSEYIVETIEPVTLLSLRKDQIELLYEQYPSIKKLGRLVITDLLLNKEYWEIDRIRYSTKERFAAFISNNPDLLQRVPQKFLASYLNMKPETFSRLKHSLQKKLADPTPVK